MRLISCFVFILILSSCSSPLIDKSNGTEDLKDCINFYSLSLVEGRYQSNGKNYSGCVSRFHNGDLVFYAHVIDGQFQGEFKQFKEGVLFKSGNFKNNYVFGQVNTYFANGNVFRQDYYNSDGILNGISKEYFESGELALVQEYKLGQKDGEYKQYFIDGSIEYDGQFKNGNLFDTTWGYYNDGKVRSILSRGESNEPGFTIYYLNPNRETYFFGENLGHKNIGTWYYKMKTDSCFIREFDAVGNFIDRECSCIDFPSPKLIMENF